MWWSTDESRNLYQLLLMRSKDVAEMKDWLTYNKYMSHDIINELMSRKVLTSTVKSIKSWKYCQW